MWTDSSEELYIKRPPNLCAYTDCCPYQAVARLVVCSCDVIQNEATMRHVFNTIGIVFRLPLC